MCCYNTSQVSVPMSVEFDELKKIRESPGDEANNMVEFSDEEGYGKFLDLHECYTLFINLKVQCSGIHFTLSL